MEARMPRHGSQARPQASRPANATPPPPPQQQQGKIPVVYYLCKNRQLEQPHFVEVPVSSGGLYLRDVIERLNAVRGRGMAAMYAWSCKRGYKNGFVWHDLGEDDLVLPAHGDEYVLKGSEIIDPSPSVDDKWLPCSFGDQHHDGTINPQMQMLTQRRRDSSVISLSSRARDSPVSISLASPPPPTLPCLREAELSPSTNRSSTSENFSPETVCRNAPTAECRAGKPVRVLNASTQTEERGRRKHGSSTRIVDIALDVGSIEKSEEITPCSKEEPAIVREEILPPVTSSPAAFSPSFSSSCGRTDTLKTLIRDELSQRNDARITEDEEDFIPAKAKLKATDMLVQLITCGAISAKDHDSLRIVSNHRPRCIGVSPSFSEISSSMRLGEGDCSSGSQRTMGLRMEEENNFVGNATETRKYREESEEGSCSLQSSSEEEGNQKTPDSGKGTERMANSGQSKCLPRAIRIASYKQSKMDTIRSPSSGVKIFSSGSDSTKSSPLCSSKGGSKRITDDSSSKGSSSKLDSFREETKKMIKIEDS